MSPQRSLHVVFVEIEGQNESQRMPPKGETLSLTGHEWIHLEAEGLRVEGASFVEFNAHGDFHDGSVVSVEQQFGKASVRVRGASDKMFVVDFGGVRAVRANQPEGMMLYALSELSGEPPLRRFAFANWHEDSPAFLEVEAETIAVREG
jgi:hypothetical protein